MEQKSSFLLAKLNNLNPIFVPLRIGLGLHTEKLFSCLVFYMTVEAEILLHNARGVMIQLDNDSTFFPQALEKIVAGMLNR